MAEMQVKGELTPQEIWDTYNQNLAYQGDEYNPTLAGDSSKPYTQADIDKAISGGYGGLMKSASGRLSDLTLNPSTGKYEYSYTGTNQDDGFLSNLMNSKEFPIILFTAGVGAFGGLAVSAAGADSALGELGINTAGMSTADLISSGAGASTGGTGIFDNLTNWLKDVGGDWTNSVKEILSGPNVLSPVDATGVGSNVVDAGVGGGDAVSTVANQAADAAGAAPDAAKFANVAGNPADALQVQAGDLATGSGAPAADTTVAEKMFTEGARAGSVTAPPGTSTGGGLINSVLDWGKANPQLASGVLQAGGGLLKGIGDRSTAMEITNKRIAADQALQDSRVQNAIDLENAKRAIIQGSSMFDSTLALKPGNTPLKRPDGTPVYGPNGLITSQMH